MTVVVVLVFECLRVLDSDFGTVRLPAPTASAEMTFEGYSNKIGFGATIVKDLQRVIICLEMQTDDKAIDQEYATKVATAEFGARVTVPMSAQPEWRTGFSRSMMSWTIQVSVSVAVSFISYMILIYVYCPYIYIMFYKALISFEMSLWHKGLYI